MSAVLLLSVLGKRTRVVHPWFLNDTGSLFFTRVYIVVSELVSFLGPCFSWGLFWCIVLYIIYDGLPSRLHP